MPRPIWLSTINPTTETVRDLDRAIGYRKAENIRTPVKKHRSKLAEFGTLCEAKIVSKGARGSTTATEFHLNRKQVIYLTTQAGTLRARAMTVVVVEVWAIRIQKPAAPIPPVAPVGALSFLMNAVPIPGHKAFQDWVTKEVLPSIRKNGGYIMGQEKLAESHGMTSDELVKKSTALRPTEHLTDTEKELNALREEISRRDRIFADLKRRFATATKDELIELLTDLRACGIWKG